MLKQFGKTYAAMTRNDKKYLAISGSFLAARA